MISTKKESSNLEEVIQSKSARLADVDFLRGLVMILMVLDHTRDFFHYRVDPVDLATTTWPLFFTRWITHFCAPIFLFLAGASAFLAHASGKIPSNQGLARYLATRGLFLLFLELTLVRWGWNFNFHYDFVLLQVIWAIGLSMLTLSICVGIGLPSRWIGVVGLALVVLSSLIDLPRFQVSPESLGVWKGLWFLLVRPGPIQVFPGTTFLVAYPLLPWFGIMALGFGFGGLLLQDRSKRIQACMSTGLALTIIFIVLRALDFYGDPKPWKLQETPIKTLLSFLNCEKYPPSLLYTLMTLGPGLMILGAFDASQVPAESGRGRFRSAVITLGRVPLFFYLIQWPFIHLVANLVSSFTGQQIDWSVGNFSYPTNYGYSLPAVYIAWLAILAMLYVPSRWFAMVKQRNREAWWLSYL